MKTERKMAWLGYKKNVRGGGANVLQSASDRVLRSRNPSQTCIAMGNNISLQDQQPPRLSPTSPTITKPLPQRSLEITQGFRDLERVTEEEQSSERELINGKEEEQEKVQEVPYVEIEEFKLAGDTEKLNLLMGAVNTLGLVMTQKLEDMQMTLSCEEEGVFPRLRECESAVEDFRDRIEKLE